MTIPRPTQLPPSVSPTPQKYVFVASNTLPGTPIATLPQSPLIPTMGSVPSITSAPTLVKIATPGGGSTPLSSKTVISNPVTKLVVMQPNQAMGRNGNNAISTLGMRSIVAPQSGSPVGSPLIPDSSNYEADK